MFSLITRLFFVLNISLPDVIISPADLIVLVVFERFYENMVFQNEEASS